MDINLFVKNFDKIKKGENFDELLGFYEDYIENKIFSLYDIYNFSFLILGVEISINISADDYVHYNLHDFLIPSREKTINEHILKSNFFKNSLTENESITLLKNIKDFYNIRNEFNLSDLTFDDFSHLDLFDCLEEIINEEIISSGLKDCEVNEENIIHLYDDFKVICYRNYQNKRDEIRNIICNDNLLSIITTDFNESDFIEIFLYDIVGCKEFRSKRRGCTSSMQQVPYLNSIYLYNLRNEKIVLDIRSSKTIINNFKTLF